MQLQPSTVLKAFPWPNGFLVLLLISGIFFAVAAGIAPLMVWGTAVALGLIFWCFTSSLKGLALVIALSSLFVRSTEEITPFEIAYTVLFGVVVLGWVMRRMSAGLPFTQMKVDRVLAWFLMICVASILPAIGQGNDLIKWVRELVPFLLFLPYFLVVSLLRKKAELRWFCIAYLILSVSMGLINVYDYWIKVADTRQQWELLANRQAPGEPLFFTTLTITLLFLVYRGVWTRRSILYLGIIAFCTVALAITFSRGYWVGALIALGFAYLYMPADKRRRMVLYVGTMIGLATMVILFFMGQLIIDIIVAMGNRLTSVFTTALDLSVRNRLVESTAVLDEIIASPIWGYGLGYYYNFHPLIPYLTPTWYVHNVYLYLWLKLGLFGLATFLVWYGMVLHHASVCVRRLSDPFLRPLILGIMCIMIAMIPLSFTSPQFIQKDSILFLALGTGIIERIYRSRDWKAPLEA